MVAAGVVARFERRYASGTTACMGSGCRSAPLQSALALAVRDVVLEVLVTGRQTVARGPEWPGRRCGARPSDRPSITSSNLPEAPGVEKRKPLQKRPPAGTRGIVVDMAKFVVPASEKVRLLSPVTGCSAVNGTMIAPSRAGCPPPSCSSTTPSRSGTAASCRRELCRGATPRRTSASHASRGITE